MKELHKFKVKSGDTELEFSLVEASRSISREGEMLYAKVHADCVRMGLMTNAEALKLSNERGGVFSENEKDDYIKCLQEYVNKEKQIDELKLKNEDVTLLEKDIKNLKESIVAYQGKVDNIYELTAESKAKDTVLLHYALALTHKDGKQYFEGKDYDAKLKNFDAKHDDLKDAVLKRSVWYTTAIFSNIKDLDQVKYPEDLTEPKVEDAQNLVSTSPEK